MNIKYIKRQLHETKINCSPKNARPPCIFTKKEYRKNIIVSDDDTQTIKDNMRHGK